MLFTAASFTISTVGTVVSVIGLIRQSKNGESGLSRLGWGLLVVVGVSYLLGIVSLLVPPSELPQFLPATSALPATLVVVVGAIGTLNCSYLARVRRWRSWAVAGLVLIPVATVAGVGYYLIY